MRLVGKRAGFTLIEILIALTIIMVGLVGIMAVFPAAMRSANMTVEASYAAAISQSVIDSIRLGLRQARVRTDAYDTLLFIHDGVQDLEGDYAGALRDLDLAQITEQQMLSLLKRDYCVLLPKSTEVENSSGKIGAAYLFPRASPGDNAGRKKAVPVEVQLDGTNERTTKLPVEKVYELGRWIKDTDGKDEEQVLRDQRDPYWQYSFAFTIRPQLASKVETPSANPSQHEVVEGLYEVVVMIYRNFSPNLENRHNEPIAEFVTYISAL